MAEPGYGPNGQRITVSGRVTWDANGPILSINSGDDVWRINPLGVVTIPFIDQDDEEGIVHIYPGGT